MNTQRLTCAQNNLEYWADTKYYLKNDLRDAWAEHDEAYLQWAVVCARSVPRAKYLVQDLMHDLSLGSVEDIVRHLDFCQTHGFEVDGSVLGRATAFSIDVVKNVAERLLPKILTENATVSVYYAVVHGNIEALEYFDSLFDLRDIASRLRDCDMTDTAATVDMYVVKRALTEHTNEYMGEQRNKKM